MIYRRDFMKISKDKLTTIIIIVVSFIIGFVLAYLIEKNQPLEIPQLFAKNETGTCVEFIRGGYTWEKGLFNKIIKKGRDVASELRLFFL